MGTHKAYEWLLRLSDSIDEVLTRRVPRLDESAREELERTARLARTLSEKVDADALLDKEERDAVGKVLGALAALEGTERAGEVDVEMARIADIINDDSPVREFKH